MRQSVSGVGVLDKAALILDALASGPLGLLDLAGATGLPRATAHRLAIALEAHEWVDRDGLGRFVLGPGLSRLAASAGVRPDVSLVDAATPRSRCSGMRRGRARSCSCVRGSPGCASCRLESPHSLRTIVAVGATLPMDRGSAAKVLAGDPEVVRRGWAQSVEERERGVASVSAPVVVDGAVVAAVSVSGPIERTSRQPGRKYADVVVGAARTVEAALGAGGR